SVVNTYLESGLTADEADFILANADRYVMTIGVGDRRTGTAVLGARFAIATNWSGENVSDLQLTPDPFSAGEYRHRLTLAGRALTVTDSHSGTNTYGSIRYFTVEPKSS
ncbi:hypothetical protein, partial [Pseudomonas caspiana]|uniref:hypothetical protein n=1 Tax=Pseudomonas caspiana TaxID=1451454 RepID=UPI001EE6EB6F